MRWIMNCFELDKNEHIAALMLGNPGRKIIVGRAKDTKYKSAHELTSMTVVGLYDVGVMP